MKGELFVDKISKKIRDAVKQIFKKEIYAACKKSKEIFAKQNYVRCKEVVVENLMDELLEYHSWRLCQKTFVYEFHEYRKSLSLPPDTASHKAFDTYVQLLGLQRFVKKIPVNNAQLQEAYYNLGVCAAVFSVIGALDLHDENLLFCNTMPYFVDLETCLSSTIKGEYDSFLELLNSMISRSVVATSILPAKMPTVPHEVLIGAINTPYPQKTKEKMFGIKNWGTDAVDIAKMEVEISHCAHSLTLEDGSAPDPVPYQNEFVNGFIDGYQEIMMKQKQIADLLANEKCSVRIIVRPTVQYALILDAMLFPENLLKDDSVERVLSLLKETKLIQDEKVAQSILEQERKSLKNGDIPYFYMNANETCMKADDFISKKAFSITPRENAVISLKQLSHKRLLQEKRLIAEGYSDIRIHEAKYLEKEHIGYLSPFFVEMLESVTKDNPYPIFDLIISLAIENKSCAGWLAGVYGEIPFSYSSSEFISFHDMGGDSSIT